MEARVPVSTRSIEQVLSPIAEQVSQLIVLDQRAAQSNAPIPDLTGAAEAISMATRSLVLAGRESTAGGDNELQSQMPRACEQVQAAGKLFMQATMELKKDPYAQKGRSMLVEAAQGILAGTTSILITFDSYEVRKIVVLGESVTSQLTAVKGVRTLETLVSSVRTLSEAMIALAQLADARHEELMNASLRSRLLIANETLRKSSPLLVTALRTYVQNPGSTQAEASRDYAIDQLLGATNEIVQVVTSTELDDDTYDEKPGIIAASFELVNAQLIGEAAFRPNDVQLAVQQILADSAVIAQSCTHEACVDELGELEDAIHVAMEQLVSAQDSADRQYKADLLKESMDALNFKLQEATVRNVTEAFVEFTAVEELVTTVQSGCSSQQLELAASSFAAHAKSICESSQQVASLSTDTKRVRMVAATTVQLNECAEQIINSCRIVQQNPGSKVAQEHLTLLKSNWDHRVEVLKATVHGMTDAGTVINVSGEIVKSDMVKAQTAAQAGDREGTAAYNAAISRRLDHISTVAISEVENSEDAEFRAPAEASSIALRAAVPQFIASTTRLAERPDDRQALQQLSADIGAVSYAIDQVSRAVAPTVPEPPAAPQLPDPPVTDGPPLPQRSAGAGHRPVPPPPQASGGEHQYGWGQAMEAETAGQAATGAGMAGSGFAAAGVSGLASAVAAAASSRAAAGQGSAGGAGAGGFGSSGGAGGSGIASATPDEPVVTANPKSGPIGAAAANLRRETLKFEDQSNPLIVVANEMAFQMEFMGTLAKEAASGTQTTAGDIIETAKVIADCGNQAVRHARDVASSCADKRLRADLLYICDRIPTIATQLKIIASVKVTSRSSDMSETDAMLVKNAQNLMDAVTRAVRACEIASLKRFGAAANVAASAMKWRKKAKRPLVMVPE